MERIVSTELSVIRWSLWIPKVVVMNDVQRDCNPNIYTRNTCVIHVYCLKCKLQESPNYRVHRFIEVLAGQ